MQVPVTIKTNNPKYLHTALWSCTHIPNKYYLKKQIFDLEVKGQGPIKVIMVRDTPPYGHAPTYQIWCVTYHNDLRGTLTFDLKVK
jgi:hypothetical protein